jgi:hypothetical protein
MSGLGGTQSFDPAVPDGQQAAAAAPAAAGAPDTDFDDDVDVPPFMRR